MSVSGEGEKKKKKIPSDGQRIANYPLTATGVLYIHRDGRRVGHISETTLWDETDDSQLYLIIFKGKYWRCRHSNISNKNN